MAGKHSPQGGHARSEVLDLQLLDNDILDGRSCTVYAIDRAREYAATVHFIGLLAGIGPDADVAAARATVRAVLEQIGAPTSLSQATRREEETQAAAHQARSDFDVARIMNQDAHDAAWEQAGSPTGAAYDTWVSSDTSLPSSLREAASQRNAAIEAARVAYDDRTGVMHQSLVNLIDRVWSSMKDLYDQLIASIKNGTWKEALCKATVDAGFAIMETGLAAALTAIGLGAAAAFLKIVSKIASAGSKMVRISVRASRNIVRDRTIHPDRHHAERDYPHEIDTDQDLSADEKRILGEENQGNTRKTDDEGEAATDGSSGRKDDDEEKSEDQREDGSYRNPNDPTGVRRAADGEAMVQDPKTGDWKRISDSSNNAKGNFGEVMADRHMAGHGYTKINGDPAQIGDKIDKGIDGVYHKTDGVPEYIVADAKYGSARLGTVKGDIKQMSPKWITDRLPSAVGKRDLRQIVIKGYDSQVLKIDKDGNVSKKSLADIQWREHEK